ncbi:antigen 5 like allergen Cul n 1-like [Musca vetustissima]|uniref:antigen 5 like allergen Cul n 1-like n=1 Tax=Musca vetustissima TaxID=27455 RepID=UPI002AB77757|nr:antigen 5 like allergen Cul n 1-like [Musca vetustissima]
MTPKLRNFILNVHNRYRNNLAGGKVKGFGTAKRMASMKWNKEFEFLSGLNLLQCEMKHDKCRPTPDHRYVGQNLAFLHWSNFNLTTEMVVEFLIDYWFQEKRYMTMNDIVKFPIRPKNAPMIGHFTMFAQERADEVGCSVMRQTSPNGTNELYLACDYSFTNFYQVPIYRPGKPASACTTGPHRKYKNLCSEKEVYNTNTHKY